MITRESPVSVLSGVGKVRAEAYRRIGIETLGDLLSHYPRRYENRGKTVSLAQAAQTDQKCSMILTVATPTKSVRLRSHKSFLKFRAFDESASCEVVYFNQDYLKNAFPIGSTFRFFGKAELKRPNALTLSSPTAEPYLEGRKLPDLVPIYSATDGLTPKQIAKDTALALSLLGETSGEPLPSELLQRRELCNLAEAEKNIHLPQSEESLLKARKRLVYQEFFDFSLGLSVSHQKTQSKNAPVCKEADLAGLYSQLPYQLTNAQQKAIADIRADMAKPTPMNRILVGDVGCGKTICAAAAMLIAVENGRQAVMMAPTEILARQHFRDFSAWFGELGISCALLIGATPAGEKKRIKEALAATDPSERLQVVIGTHALISAGVEFAAPGLVVTDEQHRFGANQRATLAEKNLHAHLLVMSATPIPRSLALVLYGDLNISRIDEMPACRQRVDTFCVDESYRERLDGFIQKQIDSGGQVYVVCPAVEESEEPEEGSNFCDFYLQEPEEGRPPLKSAVNFADTLSQKFPDAQIAFLHGKMKPAQKDSVMQKFAEGKVQILVATTVIEVGVNVPNATLMIVENAERFGLSQLHQLRGRVGRGNKKSYCVLVMGGIGKVSQTSKERLEVMRTNYDGYAIAEEDLKQRGPGDFLRNTESDSLRQSGTVKFRLANAETDCEIMMQASSDAKELAKEDATLQKHPELQNRINRLFRIENGFIS